MAEFRRKNVTVIVGCTYEVTARAIIAALEKLDYAPFAFLSTSSVSNAAWGESFTSGGWWQGAYAIGETPWFVTRAERGEFTNMTSMEFVARYVARHGGTGPSYQGIAPLAALCALCVAIEAANSLVTEAVKAALENLQLREFYGDIQFTSASHQTSMPMLGLQIGETVNANPVKIVSPMESATGPLHFPTPPWAYRRCVHVGAGLAYGESAAGLAPNCSNTADRLHGVCTALGMCECAAGFTGPACDPETNEDDAMVQRLRVGFGIVAGLLAAGLLVFAAVVAVRRVLLFRRLQAERDANVEKLVRESIKMTQTFSYPAVFVRASNFIGMGKLTTHEELREQGLLIVRDSLDSDDMQDESFIFYSHQWTSDGDPDPTNKQYSLMVAACKSISEQKGWSLDNVLVWVEYHFGDLNSCCPSRALKDLGFESLLQTATAQSHRSAAPFRRSQSTRSPRTHPMHPSLSSSPLR
jgi:hypothetical protein